MQHVVLAAEKWVHLMKCVMRPYCTSSAPQPNNLMSCSQAMKQRVAYLKLSAQQSAELVSSGIRSRRRRRWASAGAHPTTTACSSAAWRAASAWAPLTRSRWSRATATCASRPPAAAWPPWSPARCRPPGLHCCACAATGACPWQPCRTPRAGPQPGRSPAQAKRRVRRLASPYR